MPMVELMFKMNRFDMVPLLAGTLRKSTPPAPVETIPIPSVTSFPAISICWLTPKLTAGPPGVLDLAENGVMPGKTAPFDSC